MTTQKPAPQAPIHVVVLYTTTAAVAVTAVLHMLVALDLDWPPHSLILHIAGIFLLALSAWRAEVSAVRKAKANRGKRRRVDGVEAEFRAIQKGLRKVD